MSTTQQEHPPEEIPPDDTRKTIVEIEKHRVVKELCAARGISLRELINTLIGEYIMREGGEYFTLRYFKGMAGRR